MGTHVKVDTNTLNVDKGRFARIYVKIDLTLSVVKKVNVNGHWYNVQYEDLHVICSNYGSYGHHIRDCKTPDNLTQSVVPTVVQPRGPL